MGTDLDLLVVDLDVAHADEELGVEHLITDAREDLVHRQPRQPGALRPAHQRVSLAARRLLWDADQRQQVFSSRPSACAKGPSAYTYLSEGEHRAVKALQRLVHDGPGQGLEHLHAAPGLSSLASLLLLPVSCAELQPANLVPWPYSPCRSVLLARTRSQRCTPWLASRHPSEPPPTALHEPGRLGCYHLCGTRNRSVLPLLFDAC